MDKPHIHRASKLLITGLAVLLMASSHIIATSGAGVSAQSPATVQVTTVTIPSYPYYEHLEPRYRSEYNMYLYYLDWGAYYNSHPDATPRSLTAVILSWKTTTSNSPSCPKSAGASTVVSSNPPGTTSSTATPSSSRRTGGRLSKAGGWEPGAWSGVCPLRNTATSR